MTDLPVTEGRWTSGRGVLLVLTALLMGPVVWAIRFMIVYVLAGVACTTGGVIAMGVVTVAALAACLLGAWMAWGIWSEVGSGPTTVGGVIGRTRFLAMCGLVFGLWFALVIVVEAIPMFFIEPCRA